MFVTVVHSDGTPAAGSTVAFSRSISGRSPNYQWVGTTDADGQAQIHIAADAVQFWRSGASGYYLARATDPASGKVLGEWGSIPIDGGRENHFTLPIGGPIQIQPPGPQVIVMTQNLYLGTDINRILAPANPEIPIPVLAAQAWAVVQQTNFPERARAIADEIASVRPHLIGLQEVSLFRIQNPGDVLAGNPVPATEVAIDFLAVLLAELEARGLTYRAAAISEGVDIELPLFTGQTTPMADIRMTDREVILVRDGVQVGNIREEKFQARVPVTVGGLPVQIPRAWASVEAKVAGRTVRFFATHLETGAVEPVQRLQAGELLQIIGAEPLPVILLGDFNSDALGTTTQTYSDLVGAGMTDVWNVVYSDRNGFTGSQLENLLNVPSALSKRVDLIFTRSPDGLEVLGADVLGDEIRDRTPSGLWPSDHAGVVAWLRFPTGK